MLYDKDSNFKGMIMKYYPQEEVNVLMMEKDYLLDNVNGLGRDILSFIEKVIFIVDLNIDNTIINRISKNKSIYCLSMEKNNDTLSICNKKKMYVVIPSIVGDYLDIKNNLTNGSIILLNDMNNLDIIVKYINSKGYMIVPLEELLTE